MSSSTKPSPGSVTLTRDQQQRRWEAFRSRPGNRQCCECDAGDTTWAVLDYGILICINCAGAHRALGSHISKVRSTELDDFDESLFLWFESLGNKKNNERWEAELPATMLRPSNQGPECIRRWWLRAKYDEMRFLAGSEDRDTSHESRRGWLLKQGHFLASTWRQRFVVVEGPQLLYYTDEDCDAAKLKGALPLAGASVRVDPDDSAKFVLTTRDGETSHDLALRASSQAELEAWVWCLFHASHAAGKAPSDAPLRKVSRRSSLKLFSRASIMRVPEPGDPRFERRSMPTTLVARAEPVE